jgi:mRNA-degrading endonuclease RelE of RelBE toxin-antitoxin system
MPYDIDVSPEARDHLRELTARERGTVLDAIEEQLAHQPTVETRNRKLMRPNPIAQWELRVGTLRVYYDVEEADEPSVMVRAVGRKLGNRVLIGGEEYSL